MQAHPKVGSLRLAFLAGRFLLRIACKHAPWIQKALWLKIHSPPSVSRCPLSPRQPVCARADTCCSLLCKNTISNCNRYTIGFGVCQTQKLKWRTHTHLLDIVSALADTQAANSRTLPALTSTSSHGPRHLASRYGRCSAWEAKFTPTHWTKVICGSFRVVPQTPDGETQRMNETKMKNATLPSSYPLPLFIYLGFRRFAVDGAKERQSSFARSTLQKKLTKTVYARL